MKKWTIVGILLAITVASEALALYSLQKAAKDKNNIKWLCVGMAVYGTLVAFLLYKMMTYEGVGMVNFLWNIFSTMSGFIIGIMIFKEKVNNLQWAGVALGILAFGLIIFGDHEKQKQLPA